MTTCGKSTSRWWWLGKDDASCYYSNDHKRSLRWSEKQQSQNVNILWMYNRFPDKYHGKWYWLHNIMALCVHVTLDVDLNNADESLQRISHKICLQFYCGYVSSSLTIYLIHSPVSFGVAQWLPQCQWSISWRKWLKSISRWTQQSTTKLTRYLLAQHRDSTHARISHAQPYAHEDTDTA